MSDLRSYARAGYLFRQVPVLLLLLSCKTKAPVASSATGDIPPPGITITGKVSHMYVATGCGPVIVCPRQAEKDTLVLIPVNALNEFDHDQLSVHLTYHPLKIHAKKGCGPGIPVQVISIRKK